MQGNKKVCPYAEIKAINRNSPCGSLNIRCTKDFKSAVLNMSKELNKIVSKEVKDTVRMMFHHIKNINTEIEIIKRRQIEILELNYTIITKKKI